MQSQMPRSRTSRTTCNAGGRVIESTAPIIRAPILLPIEPSARPAGQRRDTEPSGSPLFVLDDGDDGFRPHQEWGVLAGQLHKPGRAREHRHCGLHVLGAELHARVAAIRETNNCHVRHIVPPSAAANSLFRSSIGSMPVLTRSSPSPIPSAARCSLLMLRCELRAG